eukprot:289831-Pleurochrysis_carterae.AAC.2
MTPDRRLWAVGSTQNRFLSLCRVFCGRRRCRASVRSILSHLVSIEPKAGRASRCSERWEEGPFDARALQREKARRLT